VSIYVNVTLIDQIPEKKDRKSVAYTTDPGVRTQTTVGKGGEGEDNRATVAKHDPALNKFMIQKDDMAKQIKDLEKTNTQLQQE